MSQPTIIRRHSNLRMLALLMLLAGGGFLLSNLPGEVTSPSSKSTPEQRALAYLEVEAPRWHAENHCYSCHNNGDGVRALLVARAKGLLVSDESLTDTRAWLVRPANWDHNGGEGGFSDKILARIQFARTLAEMRPRDADVGLEAAQILGRDQRADGSWNIEGGGDGSPCTYGNALATALACQTLKSLAPQAQATAIRQAEQWLSQIDRRSVLDDVAILIGIDRGYDKARQAARESLLKSQANDGGWGLYPASVTEPFDTAMALLALAGLSRDVGVSQAIERGRKYLLAAQQPDGGWIETTRPPGAVSYAQRISTTAWAMQALLATRNRQVWR